MKYTKELHNQIRKLDPKISYVLTDLSEMQNYNMVDVAHVLLDEIDRLNRYITALENCEVRSKTVIKILRTQTGMEA